MEEKNKNLIIYTRKVLKTPNTAVSISWKCTQNSWYTLHQLKKGYKIDDEQLQNGGNCVVLCYSLFQRLNRRTKLFDDSKFPIDCFECNINNGYFQISYNTSNKLSAIKKSLKYIIQNMNPSTVYQQYQINMKNIGGNVDKREFNWSVNKLNEILKSEINIVFVGNVKLTSTKAGKKISEKENLKTLSKYLLNVFPKLTKADKSSAPKQSTHNIPENNEHITLKLKNNTTNVDASLTSEYIFKTLGLRADSVDKKVIIWHKSPESKINSIKKINRIKKSFSKKDPAGNVAYSLLRKGETSNINIKKFSVKNPSVDVMSKAILTALISPT